MPKWKYTAGLIVPALGLCTLLWGQAPISDVLVVRFPNSVRIGDHTAPAGEYTVRQLPTASNPRLLEFSSGNGTKIETSITTIPAVDNNNRNETSVVLERAGADLVLRRIWIQGKTYGYEIPAGVSNMTTAQTRGTAGQIRLSGTYTEQQAQVAQAPPPAPAPTPAPEPAPTPAPQPQTQAQAQTPEPAPAPAPAPEPTPAPQPEVRAQAQTPAMPATATNWPLLAAAGFVLIGLGAMLERPSRNP